MVRYIRIGKKTEAHLDTLQKMGYEVKKDGDFIEVQATAVNSGEVDISTAEAAKASIGGAIKAKAVFDYTTKFKFASGKTLHGVLACGQLGKFSALVTKGEKEKAKKATSGALADLLVDLGI
jgi:hypothetical protein